MPSLEGEPVDYPDSELDLNQERKLPNPSTDRGASKSKSRGESSKTDASFKEARESSVEEEQGKEDREEDIRTKTSVKVRPTLFGHTKININKEVVIKKKNHIDWASLLGLRKGEDQGQVKKVTVQDEILGSVDGVDPQASTTTKSTSSPGISTNPNQPNN